MYGEHNNDITCRNKENQIEQVKMYTDGGCLGNPGRGGYGTILAFEKDSFELFDGYRLTTNNRMELMACIFGLEALDHEYDVTVFSDSKYLVDSVSKGWAMTWKQNNWRRSGGSRAENIDLWERLLSLIQKHQIKFVWVKAHNGHEEIRINFSSIPNQALHLHGEPWMLKNGQIGP